MLHRKSSRALLFGGLLIFTASLLLPAAPTEAQCGTQASSCKSCHEVQGELPVNADGTGWHESHAFGDFCYICHAGNQQAMEADAAHEGMVPPLSDVKASCQMCHAEDLDARAQVYAALLNVELSSGSASSGSVAPTNEPSSDDFWGGEPAAPTSAPAEAAASPVPVEDEQAADCLPLDSALVVDDASMVDYVQRYEEIVLGKTPTNWGNVALIAMIGLLVVGGGGFVVLNEIRVNLAAGEMRKAEGEYPADVVEMLPALANLKTQTRRALKKILDNPQKSDKVLGLIETVIEDEDNEEPPQ